MDNMVRVVEFTREERVAATTAANLLRRPADAA